jgi:hypothetical protein
MSKTNELRFEWLRTGAKDARAVAIVRDPQKRHTDS